MTDPISLSISTPCASILTASTPTELKDKYLHYLDTTKNLKENTTHLSEKTKKLPFYSNLTQCELFSRQNEELQELFKKTIAQAQEDCAQLGKLTSPTPTQSDYEKKITEQIEDMHNALQQHKAILQIFNNTILAMKDKTDRKTLPTPSTENLRSSTPVLVRQQSLLHISPSPSPTFTPLQEPFSPPALTHQTTDVSSTLSGLVPSSSDTIQSLRRRDTDVTLLTDPIYLRTNPQTRPLPSSPLAAPITPSLSTRFWRKARSFFSFQKKGSRLPET